MNSGATFQGKFNSLTTAFLVILGDWVTKAAVHMTLDYGHSRPIIDGFIDLVHVRNFGSAFGILNQGKTTGFNTWFFAVASVFGLILLIYLISHEDAKNTFAIVCLGLLLGGVIGNQGERLLHGYVTDFLDF